MKVTFASFGENIASSRLRATIPQRELAKLGVKQGRDILVYGKHFISREHFKPFKKLVFDVCDDHFKRPVVSDYYREHCELADLVTCNSETMAGIIKTETGRNAVVIPDPYESDEKPAGAGKGILWFGHESNLDDLKPYLDLPGLEILTGDDWSREKQLAALNRCGCVIIPTGRSMAKSANRLIESVRNGRFVIAGELPAHEEFRDWMWIDSGIRDGVDWFNDNRYEAIEEVNLCQKYIENHYSPERIGFKWLDVLRQL